MPRWTSPRCESWTNWTNSFLAVMALCFIPGLRLGLCQSTAVSQATASGEYRVAGTVVSKSDGHPLDHALIVLVDVKNRANAQTTITKEDGRFSFEGLAGGKYSLGGERKGYINAAYDAHEQYSTAIVTGAGLDTEHLALRLAPAGIIAGRVLDESGEPVRNATVTIYFDDHSSGVGQVRQFRGAQTDDQGDYEIASLMPGTYFLSASATPWYAVHPNRQTDVPGLPPASVDPSLDVTYPLTYYGDETAAEDATPIPIRGGERLQADIHLNPAHALSLRFRVPTNEQGGFRVPQLQQSSFDGGMTYVQTTGVTMVSPGLMEITGVPAGKYNVRIDGDGFTAQMSGLEVDSEGQELNLSSAEALSNVKVSVSISGETTLLHRGVVALQPTHKAMVAWQRVNEKGEAELPQVPAGVYDVDVWNFGKAYAVDQMTVNGVAVKGRRVTIVAGSLPSISITLVPGEVQVNGVISRAGKGVAGAMVVLVPNNPDLHRDLFRRDQSDLDGTFSLQGVVPGSYTVLAIDDGWDLDWSEPAVIAAYLKGGRTIKAAGQSRQSIDLGAPIEVQSK
jgi:protocatechuate 3,4-dioxygenase beta subunit